MRQSSQERSAILDPAKVTGISDEKKEYYLQHGFVPYQINGGRVKWAQKRHAIREVQTAKLHYSTRNPFREFSTHYERARQDNNSFVAFFSALWRFLAETR